MKPEIIKNDSIETEQFNTAYTVVLNEFEEEIDDGEGDDSWWWEERQRHNNDQTPPLETDYSSALSAHKNLAPTETRKIFNSYEQCNRLIICTETKSELVQRFCDIIDGLTANNEEAQRKLIDMIDSVAEL